MFLKNIHYDLSCLYEALFGNYSIYFFKDMFFENIHRSIVFLFIYLFLEVFIALKFSSLVEYLLLP